MSSHLFHECNFDCNTGGLFLEVNQGKKFQLRDLWHAHLAQGTSVVNLKFKKNLI